MNKEQVRQLAREMGLANSEHAASPCLRSRLALGVKALPESLQKIEEAEEIVKKLLQKHISIATNLRVRHLRDGGARVEVDADVLDNISPDTLQLLSAELVEIGYDTVKFASFKTGSVSVN